MFAGTGRSVISPEPGMPLQGFGGDYPNEGVHDDISVTALYLRSGDDEAVLLTYDLIGLYSEQIINLRRAAAETTGLGEDQVFTHCTHVHSGPTVMDRSKAKRGGPNTVDPAYMKALCGWTGEAAAQAKADAVECDLHYNFDFVPENMNRRYSFANGDHEFIPHRMDLRGRSWEYNDTELGIIAFKRTDATNKFVAVVTNYAAHPLATGNSSYQVTADYVGVLRRTIEESFGGAMALALTGAAGDHHPIFPCGGFAEAERMGRALGTVANARLFDSVKTIDTTLRTRWGAITCQGHHGPVDTAYYLLGIGPVLLVGMPGEPSAILGAQLKGSSPFLKTYPCMMSSDNTHYMPSRNQFLWGGFEVRGATLKPGEPEKIVHQALADAEALVAERPLELPEPRPWR